ncbi:hypothetical protein, partial [Alistipes dispar]|uniref:hypothetical protein n=1 Tax=Alistipes dispar TaxID=2585119 RepID=UPI003A95A0F3
DLFLGGAALIAAVASVVITVYENEKNVPDLFDANGEALTSDEVIIQRPCVYYPSHICIYWTMIWDIRRLRAICINTIISGMFSEIFYDL